MYELFKQNKMYRVFLVYQFFSAIGSGIFSMFILLATHLIYQNPLYTSIAGFLIAAPHIFSFAVGPVVDRRDKIVIMRITTLLEFLVLSLLAFTPLLDNLGVMFMFAVIFVYSIAELFESPASSALLPQIVSGEEILQANSLINIVTMSGGIVIGIVLFTALAGEVNFNFLFGLSAVFLVAAFFISLFLKNPFDEKITEKAENAENMSRINYIADLKEGSMFVRRSILLYVVIAFSAMGFFGEITFVNRPMFLEYHVGAQGYIVFALMVLIGGIIASSFVGKVGNKFRLGRLVPMLLILSGIMRVAFAFIVPGSYAGGLAAQILYAASGSSAAIILSSLNQKVPPKDMVGRVDTILSTFLAIFIALGALAGGFLARAVPVVDYIFILTGACIVLIGVFLALIPSFRKLPTMNEIEKN